MKANAEKRAAFVATYVALCAEAEQIGAKIFFVDEAHFLCRLGSVAAGEFAYPTLVRL